MKKEKLFQALSLGQNYILTCLMRTLVIMGLLRPMNQNQLLPMIHNQKGDSKVAAAHSSKAVGGFSAKENFGRKQGKISAAVLAHVDRIAKEQGGRALEGFMVLDSASTVFATNERPQSTAENNQNGQDCNRYW